MALADTVVIRTSEGAVLVTTLTRVKVFGYPFRGSSDPSFVLSSWLRSGRLRSASPKGLLVIAKVWFPAFTLSKLDARQPKARHRDLESRALAVLPAGVRSVWMKAHQSDKDADEGRVERSDLQGNRMADVAANHGASEHVPFEPSEEWKQW
eukprot:5909358-Amphidinium_carterae.1